MYTLYGVAGSPKARSLSPFVWKAEALLKLAKVDYQIELIGDFTQMPKGKVPVLKAGEQMISDSHFIYQFLQQKHGLDLDKHLSSEQKAIAHAFRVMAEEHLYWGNVYDRIISPAGEPFVLQYMLAGLPSDVAKTVLHGLREKMQNQLNGQGLGRHSADEIYALCQADVDAIAAYLGDKAFLFGDQISSADCSVAVILAGFVANEFDTPMNVHIRQHANLLAYIARFNQAVFGE